jgi:hypothetical protein
MGIIALYLEALFALGLFIFIVWWTMSSRKKDDSSEE